MSATIARRALLAYTVAVYATSQAKATPGGLATALDAVAFDQLHCDVFNDLTNLQDVLKQQGHCDPAHLVIWVIAALDVEDASVDQLWLELG